MIVHFSWQPPTLGHKICRRLREVFELSVPLRTIFEKPTIAPLAGVIET